MRLWTLLPACAVLLVLGQAHGKGRDPTKEEDCCTALLIEGEEGSLDAAGKYLLPNMCRGEPAPAMACPQLWFQSPAISDNDIGEPARLAFQQQSDFRADESCSPFEWEQRCPPGATMLLSKKRGGCRAAGCIAATMEGELTAQLINVGRDVEGEAAIQAAILRAVTAQETAFLQAAKPGTPKTFYMHVSGLQRAFSKASQRIREGEK
ncbi:unnamed protein product [Ectocarpus sp. 6 AP-2014]